MDASRLPPFEQAIWLWMTQTPGQWKRIQRERLTHTDDRAIQRLIKAGYLEARLSVELKLGETPAPVRTQWCVSGEYAPRLGSSVRNLLSSRGYKGACELIPGTFDMVRLTPEGQMAQRQIHENPESILVELTSQISARTPGAPGIV